METKQLMLIEDSKMKKLAKLHSTGMNFYIVETNKGFLSILEGGEAMPLYSDPKYYCIDDYLQGIAPPINNTIPTDIAQKKCFKNRFIAANTPRISSVSPTYAGGIGAFPLIKKTKLRSNTIFKRYLNKNSDNRFKNGKLTPGTYLTSHLDSVNANTGFGAVGRYALPIPLPASCVIDYELKKGTIIEIGTVGPLFGQSGGGIEICCPNGAAAALSKRQNISDY